MTQTGRSVLAPARPLPCKICGTQAPLYGAIDFNKACSERVGPKLPPAGVLIAYNRCPRCGFVFSGAFDGWTDQDFAAHIYNAGYAEVDPDYASLRPANNATFIGSFFANEKHHLSLLDYGGGNGALADQLARDGFATTATYDKFVPRFATPPAQAVNVVTCFETLEHVPDPLAAIGRLAACVAEEGVVVFSTLVQPADFELRGLFWWYVAPRNGHISIFSRDALELAWNRHGFGIVSLNASMHVACRKVPRFLERIIAAGDPGRRALERTAATLAENILA